MALRTLLTAAAIAGALALAGCEADSAKPPVGADTYGTPAETGESPPAQGAEQPRGRAARVGRVIDGDTLDLRNGDRIRLVQIDTPEAGGECYGSQATKTLQRLLPSGTKVVLERDPALDAVDRYGRLLRYVHREKAGLNVNLALVRRGAASVWFYDGDRGRYADELLAAARNAKRHRRGAWGRCRARFDPTAAFETRPRVSTATRGFVGRSCMAGYSPCLPIRASLDCDAIERMGKAPVRVTGDDPYRIDGDGDGIGCES